MEFIVIILVIIAAIVFALTCIKIVPQDKAYVIERLGSYYGIWYKGIHIKIPFIDHIAKKETLKQIVKHFTQQLVITKDNVTIKISTVIYYQITDLKLYTYSVEDHLVAIETLIVTTLRNLIGNLELEEALASRNVINAEIHTILDETTIRWGIKVNHFEIESIIPPKDIK